MSEANISEDILQNLFNYACHLIWIDIPIKEIFRIIKTFFFSFHDFKIYFIKFHRKKEQNRLSNNNCFSFFATEKKRLPLLSFLSSLIPTAWFFSPLSCVCVLLNPLTLLSTGTKLINRNHNFLFLFSVCMCVCVFQCTSFWWMCSLFYHAPVFASLFHCSLAHRHKKRITERRKTSNVLVCFVGVCFSLWLKQRRRRLKH